MILPDASTIMWYVLHVLTGRELDIKSCIQNVCFDSLVPRRKMMERKNGAWKEVNRLLLPGYVFIRLPMTDQNYYRIKGIPGVIDILRGASSSPTPVTDEEMRIILSLTNEGDLVGLSDIFMDGEGIKVISGPLLGIQGNIQKVDKRRLRAKVAFTIAGQEKTVELGINVIRKIV